VLRVPAKREGLSVISTVTNKGEMRWRIYAGAMNAKILTAFLERLTRKQPRKIFLILDNLRVHHSKVVKQWLASHAEQIEVFYLPSTSTVYPGNQDRHLGRSVSNCIAVLWAEASHCG
jgi:transposase